ncbi:MAG: histidine phosphatase family protein [Trueperaceae bacterium]
MRSDLVLVRHGRTEPQVGVPAAAWTLAPSALDDVRRLAELLAREAGPPVDAVVTSSEPKAVATGRALAKEWRVPATIGHDLEEHHRGATPVLAPEEWRQTIRRFFAQPDVLVFGSETGNEAVARFERGVRAALAERPGKRLALVTHGTVLAAALARANDLDAFALWSTLAMPEALLVRAGDLRLVGRVVPSAADPNRVG